MPTLQKPNDLFTAGFFDNGNNDFLLSASTQNSLDDYTNSLVAAGLQQQPSPECSEPVNPIASNCNDIQFVSCNYQNTTGLPSIPTLQDVLNTACMPASSSSSNSINLGLVISMAVLGCTLLAWVAKSLHQKKCYTFGLWKPAQAEEREPLQAQPQNRIQSFV